jgi:hypothetical protein
MIRIAGALGALLAILLLSGLAVPGQKAPLRPPPAIRSPAPAKSAAAAIILPPAVTEVLQSGVLIVISKASQQMYVFKDGAAWGSSPVSTGRRGKATPSGTFPILQKRVFHRSNLYSNAPMPYMQRLTWSGIAIHAGHLPGYPASHGCIRLPRAFARSLFGLTKASSTTVVITNEALATESAALTLALNMPVPRPADQPWKPATALASALPPRIEPLPFNLFPPLRRVAGQTIQLAAAASRAEAEAHWSRLLASYPALAGYEKAVIPAVVGSRQVYRLRTTAPDAHALCESLKRVGEACFNVS